MPTRLSGKLRRAATFLRKIGVEISLGDREARARTITITFSKPQEAGDSASSASSTSSTSDSNDLPMTPAMTLASNADHQRHHDDADADGRDANGRDDDAGTDTSVIANALKNNGNGADDADDAKSHTAGGSEKTAVPCLTHLLQFERGHVR
jgi:hypothetical protein